VPQGSTTQPQSRCSRHYRKSILEGIPKREGVFVVVRSAKRKKREVQVRTKSKEGEESQMEKRKDRRRIRQARQTVRQRNVVRKIAKGLQGKHDGETLQKMDKGNLDNGKRFTSQVEVRTRRLWGGGGGGGGGGGVRHGEKKRGRKSTAGHPKGSRKQRGEKEQGRKS